MNLYRVLPKKASEAVVKSRYGCPYILGETAEDALENYLFWRCPLENHDHIKDNITLELVASEY